jgi:hypothetical protein
MRLINPLLDRGFRRRSPKALELRAGSVRKLEYKKQRNSQGHRVSVSVAKGPKVI